jgi:hypothetical protein
MTVPYHAGIRYLISGRTDSWGIKTARDERADRSETAPGFELQSRNTATNENSRTGLITWFN